MSILAQSKVIVAPEVNTISDTNSQSKAAVLSSTFPDGEKLQMSATGGIIRLECIRADGSLAWAREVTDPKADAAQKQ